MSNPIQHSIIDYLAPAFVTFGTLAGVWLFQYLTQRGFRPTTGNLPPYPIILKPLPAVIFLMRFVSIAMLALGVTLVCIRLGMLVLAIPLFAIAVAGWIGASRLAKTRVIIESNRLIYKTHKKQEEMLASDMYAYYVNWRSCDLVITMEQQNKTMKIPLFFKDMCYLHNALSDWTGSVRVVPDSNGNATAAYSRDAFGT